jgi:hypothetical membrane protein
MANIPVKRLSGLFVVILVEIVIYLVLDVVAQLLPPYYSPISQAESDLSVGPYGFLMTINFVNRGLFSIIFIYAFAKTLKVNSPPTQMRGLVLVGIWAIGGFILAIFPTDVPATPVSWHGAIHLVVAIIAFICGAVGTLVLSASFKRAEILHGVRRIAMAISVLAVVFLILEYALPFATPKFAANYGGLVERIFIGLVILWVFVVSIYLQKKLKAGK